MLVCAKTISWSLGRWPAAAVSAEVTHVLRLLLLPAESQRSLLLFYTASTRSCPLTNYSFEPCPSQGAAFFCFFQLCLSCPTKPRMNMEWHA
eukprot:4112272-Amphidinium_carterae.2